MKHIYLPVDNLSDYSCYSIVDKDTIRAYNETPRLNSNISYTDFYINSHYLSKSGTQNFSQYSNLPTCVSNITNDVYYRNDLSDIFIIFTVLFFIIIFLPFKLMRRFFGRWLSI